MCFIEKARLIHGDKYDYSEVDYTNNRTKVKIICHIHGVFLQTPDKHLNFKRGCQKCGGTKKLTLDEFILKSKEKHVDIFDYTNVRYINSKTEYDNIEKILSNFF